MATTHLFAKTGALNNHGTTMGVVQVRVKASLSPATIALGDSVTLCEVPLGTIIQSVDEVVITDATDAATTTAVATITSAHDFKTAAAVGVAGSAAIGELAAANCVYYSAADTLNVVVAGGALTGADLVYVIHYYTVQTVAKP
jgi:hypothetical protein